MFIRMQVNCNCVRERKLNPVPEKFKPYIRFDGNLIYLDYTRDQTEKDDGNHPGDTGPETIDPEWEDWLENACVHGGRFSAAEAVIGPHIRLAPLKQMLDRMQDAGFQNLQRVLAFREYAEISSAAAAECLADLRQFISDFPDIHAAVVSDDRQFRNLDIILADEVKPLYSAAGYQVEYDREGLWVKRDEPGLLMPLILFHSSHFTQDQLPYGASLITDIPSGEYIELRYPLFPGQDSSYPLSVEIKQRLLIPEDFMYLTRPLQNVLKASVDTANPVYILCDRSAADVIK